VKKRTDQREDKYLNCLFEVILGHMGDAKKKIGFLLAMGKQLDFRKVFKAVAENHYGRPGLSLEIAGTEGLNLLT